MASEDDRRVAVHARARLAFLQGQFSEAAAKYDTLQTIGNTGWEWTARTGAEYAALAEPDFREAGIDFGAPRLELPRIRERKDQVIAQLTRGLASLAKQRGVEILCGEGRFLGAHELEIRGGQERRRLRFQDAIIAVGSRPVRLRGLPEDPRILDSTAALELPSPPGELLVVGGGIIGLEMASVYHAFGWKVSLVELLGHLMDGADRDLVRPLEKRIRARYEHIWLGARVADVEPRKEGLWVTLEGKDVPQHALFQHLLVAVGRRPNADRIDAERAGLQLDARGFLCVDARQRTAVPHLYAIGDVTGPPMLAHRASHQGKVAAEVIAGLPASFDPRAIPSVAYTDPEVAWTGLTEEQARAEGRALRKGLFPWSASGRALSLGRGEGLTKLLFAQEDGRLLGAGIVGPGAGELIAEATLAVELGADPEDLGLSIHPHPTLSETLAFAAEAVAGTLTELLPARRR